MSTEARNPSDAVLSAFSKAIFVKAQVTRQETLSAAELARMREAVMDDIKKVSNFVGPQVSERALALAMKHKIDLFSMTWHDRRRLKKMKQRFHLEHVRPVSALRDECLQAKTVAEVQRVLKERLRIAWVLKVEDLKLTGLGFKSRRPDPKKAYKMAQIVLVSRPTHSAARQRR